MHRQEQRQLRSLSLSLQMRLALDVLHMDTGRLRRRIGLELARNPALAARDLDILPQPEDPRCCACL